MTATTVLLIRIFPDTERAKWPHNKENEEISCFERLGYFLFKGFPLRNL
jgi:hypothetical protein